MQIKLKPLPVQTEVCNVPCFNKDKVAAVRAVLRKQENAVERMAATYKRLGNTTRLKILLALAEGELCVCDIAHVLGLSVSATSHQIKLLRDEGWVRMRNDGKMVYCRLESRDVLKALQVNGASLGGWLK